MYMFSPGTGFRAWIVLALSVLMLGALLLRVHAVWQRIPESSDELNSYLVGDEPGYEALAYALLQGEFFQSPVRVPVYPMFIAAVYSVLGERSLAKLLYVQAFVGVATILLTYLLARRFTPVIPALVAAGIVAVDDLLIDHSRYIYAEVVYTPLLLVALLAMLWALQAPRPWRFAVAGASMALVTLCRPTSALFPLLLPLLVPWGWRLQQKAGVCLAYSLVMAAVIAPWTYHNWRTFHRFLPLSVSAGALWQGSPEFYHLAQRSRSMQDIWANELNPQRNGGYDPHTIEGDRYFNRRGIESIRAEPLVYVIYSLKKAGYLWVGWGFWEMYDWNMERSWFSHSLPKVLRILVARQLPVAALAALAFLAVRGRLRPLLPFVAVCAYFTLVHMLTWGEMRYSEPLHPLLAIFLVTAAVEGFQLLKAVQRHAVPMALILAPVWGGHLGNCHAVLHHTPIPPSSQSRANPLIAVSPATLPLAGPWQFAVDSEAEGHTQGWAEPAFDDTGWLPVTVPHTWNAMPEYADYAGIAWYRRQVTLPPTAEAAHLRVRFGAVFYLAQVWWNGIYLGEHEGGYTSFEFDVSGLAKPGATNVLAVRVDNRRAMDRLPAALPTHWSFDWYHYGGIVRDVTVHLSSRAFIAHQQLVAVPTLVGVGTAERATLTAMVTVTNTSTQPLSGVLTGGVHHEADKRLAVATAPAAPVRLLPGASAEITLTATIPQPTLWHFDHPHLYRWIATLRTDDSSHLHTADETFGVRTIELRAAGLYLNGEPVRLVGLSRHADSPAHGLAEPVSVMAADFADLKRLNAVLSRPAHYPQADFILDYADRHGLLLIPEIPAWQLSAVQLSDPRIRRLARQQLREMIRSQANHPSVWAWSLGNEFASDTPAGHAFVRELMAVAKALDPTRPVGFVSNRLGNRPWADATALTDIVLMNAYYGTWSGPKSRLGPALDTIHATWPDKPVIISEYGFAARWEWIHRRAEGEPSEYYAVPPGEASDFETADRLRQQLIDEQLPVFRSRPFIAGAIFFTYQDHRTPNGLMMGLTDVWRRPSGARAVLREAYAPAVLDAVRMSPAFGRTRRATVVLRARGPVERDLPAYTLQGYRLEWRVATPDGSSVVAHGGMVLPTLPPGATWSGTLEWSASNADDRLTLRLIRPTGFAVLEHTYNGHSERR